MNEHNAGNYVIVGDLQTPLVDENQQNACFEIGHVLDLEDKNWPRMQLFSYLEPSCVLFVKEYQVWHDVFNLTQTFFISRRSVI